MIRSFRNQGTEDVFNGNDSKTARKVCPPNVVNAARRRLGFLDAVGGMGDLKVYHLEKLKGDRAGQYSIRVNDQYRICFTWNADAAEEVEIADYH
jgi:proteic killer suppression protein